MGRVSSKDRRAAARQASALGDLETSEHGTEEQWQQAVEAANADGERLGLDELKTKSEFHRKAVERGLIGR